MASLDGLKLDRFEPGFLYDVGTTLGSLMLAEGWVEPVLDEQLALLVPLSETSSLIEPKPPPFYAETVPTQRRRTASVSFRHRMQTGSVSLRISPLTNARDDAERSWLFNMHPIARV
jgi:hypothetical protein